MNSNSNSNEFENPQRDDGHTNENTSEVIKLSYEFEYSVLYLRAGRHLHHINMVHKTKRTRSGTPSPRSPGKVVIGARVTHIHRIKSLKLREMD